MKKKLIIALLSSLSFTPTSVFARETVLSTDISTGGDYQTRQYEESPTLPPPPIDTTVPPVDTAASGLVSDFSRDEEKANFFIRPSISLFSKSSEDTAKFKYSPSFLYDTIAGESGDVNHEASVDYQRSLTHDWKLKFFDAFKNTDNFSSNQMSGPKDQSGMSGDGVSGISENQWGEDLKGEMITAFPEDEDTLRNDAGLRRYTANKFNVSTDYAFTQDSSASLGYGYNIMRYDDVTDPMDTGTYQDYDKHKVSLFLSHRFNPQYRLTGYTRYVRGLYEIDISTTNNDLSEYHAGTSLASKFGLLNPITLSYDFSETDYDDNSIDSSQMHKFNLGYLWFTSPMWNVSTGMGPTYTKMSASEDSWDTNGYLKIVYRNQRSSFRFASTYGTKFDNFSGIDERSLTQYWQTRADFTYPLFENISTSLNCAYRNESRDEVTNGTEIGVDQYSAGAGFNYNFNEHYNAGLNYVYTTQDSDRSEDSYDEHRVLLSLSYKTDLLKW